MDGLIVGRDVATLQLCSQDPDALSSPLPMSLRTSASVSSDTGLMRPMDMPDVLNLNHQEQSLQLQGLQGLGQGALGLSRSPAADYLVPLQAGGEHKPGSSPTVGAPHHPVPVSGLPLPHRPPPGPPSASSVDGWMPGHTPTREYTALMPD